jgi:hypothetical protein
VRLFNRNYRRGLNDANEKIYETHFDRHQAERFHEDADSRMWEADRKGDKKSYDYWRGRAMTFGKFCNTGKLLKK